MCVLCLSVAIGATEKLKSGGRRSWDKAALAGLYYRLASLAPAAALSSPEWAEQLPSSACWPVEKNKNKNKNREITQLKLQLVCKSLNSEHHNLDWYSVLILQIWRLAARLAGAAFKCLEVFQSEKHLGLCISVILHRNWWLLIQEMEAGGGAPPMIFLRATRAEKRSRCFPPFKEIFW